MYVMGKEELAAVERVIESGNLFRYKDGSKTETDFLEAELVEKMGTEYALAMSSGTASLICALAGMGIGPGDEVIVPAYTFISTALAPLAVGAVPVLAEIDESLTIDPEDVERKISSRTRAILPVHMMGLPCDMDRIMAIAAQNRVDVLEDACQADGGVYKGRRLGTIGRAGTYSFNHFKIISAGEGGALVTTDRELYEKARIFHDGGCVFFSEDARKQQVPFYAGVNFRISEVLSAMLRVQLGRLDGILGTLRKNKSEICEVLRDVPGIQLRPVNDREGECGVVVAVGFENESRMRRFLELCAANGIQAGTPIDSGRHVYTNWEPILKRRGSHHDDRNPYSGSSITYDPEMCPNTLSILKTTAYLSPSVGDGIDLSALRQVTDAFAE